ncbi:GYF domain-containing protein [Stenotrophomonas sp. Iso1]|uniref:GYF domain-containing protein n=1 Tax=Stenotrophomonas sp. Iso1 TaxID=2977283 RepID=UPI0022B77A21|nr:GYF domain-containing protein [Stenotrophomonas sp. Iso1]
MSQWFYAESNRERRGPVPSEDIAALFRAGQLSADTLVWREGAGDWQPLRNVAGELDLHELAHSPSAAGPAGMPPLPPPLHPLPRSHAAMPSRKPATSGWVVFAAIAAVMGVALLTIGGLLAAVAVPAYQQYVLRSRIAAVETQLAPLKAEVADFVMRNERCPNNGDEGFGSPESYATDGIAQIYVGDFEHGHCGFEAQLHMPTQQLLDGKSLWLDYDTQSTTWECSSDVADKHLPLGCRG